MPKISYHLYLLLVNVYKLHEYKRTANLLFTLQYSDGNLSVVTIYKLLILTKYFYYYSFGICGV